ncbi:ATP synthase subunit e mitochondrial [Spathaspora sp. JA1]|nr:ATP synthase subunit e mitochondrial [Spathaspora sp. JA1]
MSNFNVLRWSFLGAGLFYGFYHRQSLQTEAQEKVEAKKLQDQQKLIKQAKAEYAKLNPPKPVAVSSGAINWEDPNLDIGKALESLVQKLD